MSAFKGMLVLAFVCLSVVSAAQPGDHLAAARIFGPNWAQLSRSAGMVFAATVLTVEMQPAAKDQPLPTIGVKFRVDRAIAGVQQGQVLTIREWAGAWSSHRPMRSGQRILLFLYPPSRLGLTSPVGGPLGQIALDSRGEVEPAPNTESANEGSNALQRSRPASAPHVITLSQLERAIRSARIKKDKDKE
jgi:hypothetical protein